jgi:hypothetical protein
VVSLDGPVAQLDHPAVIISLALYDSMDHLYQTGFRTSGLN